MAQGSREDGRGCGRGGQQCLLHGHRDGLFCLVRGFRGQEERRSPELACREHPSHLRKAASSKVDGAHCPAVSAQRPTALPSAQWGTCPLSSPSCSIFNASLEQSVLVMAVSLGPGQVAAGRKRPALPRASGPDAGTGNAEGREARSPEPPWGEVGAAAQRPEG